MLSIVSLIGNKSESYILFAMTFHKEANNPMTLRLPVTFRQLFHEGDKTAIGQKGYEIYMGFSVRKKSCPTEHIKFLQFHRSKAAVSTGALRVLNHQSPKLSEFLYNNSLILL